MKAGMKRCTKCTKPFHKKGIANHMKHCEGVANKELTPNKVARINKGIDMFNQAMVAHSDVLVNAANDLGSTTAWNESNTEFQKLEEDYRKLVKENENLRRVIGSQREVVDTLCRAMIENNAIEGRWRGF